MIAFGLCLSILSEAIAYGTHEIIFKDAVDMHIGSFQIHKKGYQENQTLSYIFPPNKEITKALEEEHEIIGWSKRIVGGGLVSVKDNTNVAVIIGIEPEKEAIVTNIKEKIVSGEKLKKKYSNLYSESPVSKYLSRKANQEAIVGDRLAEKLKAVIGNKIAVMVQGADGSIGNELYTVVGIYHTGSPELDSGINIHIKDAEALFSTYGNISEIAVSLPNSRVVKDIVERVRSKLDTEKYEVLSWRELSPELVQLMGLDSVGAYLFILILLLIVAFGILNTVFITIMERIREFGILKSLGTTPRQIFGLIIKETMFLTFFGVIAGNILGAAISYYFWLFPVDLSAWADKTEEFGMSASYMKAELTIYSFFVFNGIVFVLAAIASLYPAIKASRLRPIEALKHI